MSHKKTTVWDTDFRIQSELPDIKIIRSDFIVTFSVLAILIFGLLFLAQTEYKNHSLKVNTQQIQESITDRERLNTSAIKTNNSFKSIADNFTQIQTFFTQALPPHVALQHIATHKPDNIQVTRINFSETAPVTVF